ncbi:MAG: ABC transporter ATP-binding protein [Lachnospiraceae bacterium]|nr:ABC transporter ATP-binding protein [Lachnospiraceae bacterium]
MSKIILSAKDLCKSYASGGLQNHVLKNVDFELRDGEFCVVMGSSGSGKSTLLYCLSGMDTATSGEITYKDKQFEKLNEDKLARLRRKDFGFVFQQMHLVANLSIFENIAVPGYLVSKPPKVHAKAEELMEKVGISALNKRLPSQVSGGEQQRAAVARALINSPQILFADEPTGSLNSKAGLEVLDILSEFNRGGQTILMVTHDIKAAIRATRLIYIKDGKLCSEMEMGLYQGENEKARESQVVAWLTSLGW